MPSADIRRDIAGRFPAAFIKYPQGVMNMIATLRLPPKPRELVELRTWQARLMGLLKEEADDRHIWVVLDEKGGAGKSSLISHALHEFGNEAIMLSGKIADMAHMYDGQRVVFIDQSRTASEYAGATYSFAESLKNGIINKTKYMSEMYRFKPPHVVFMVNTVVPKGTWSADRARYMIIKPAHKVRMPGSAFAGGAMEIELDHTLCEGPPEPDAPVFETTTRKRSREEE